jgi:hypothetical protein
MGVRCLWHICSWVAVMKLWAVTAVFLLGPSGTLALHCHEDIAKAVELWPPFSGVSAACYVWSVFCFSLSCGVQSVVLKLRCWAGMTRVAGFGQNYALYIMFAAGAREGLSA